MNSLEYEVCIRVYRGEGDIEHHSTKEEDAILAACRRKHWLRVSETGTHSVTDLGKAELLAYCDALQEQSYQKHLDDEVKRRNDALTPIKNRKQFCRDLIVASLGGMISAGAILFIQNFSEILNFFLKLLDALQ